MGGHIDEDLLPESKDMLREIADLPADLMVFASPMRRALQTAQILFPGREIQVKEAFREINFGHLEGRTHAEMEHEEAYKKWLATEGKGKIPGGEDMEGFTDRTWSGFCEAVREAKKNRASALAIVAHGGTVMAILHRLAGGKFYDYLCANGEGYVIEWNNGSGVGDNESDGIPPATAYDRFCDGVRTGSTAG